MANKHANPPHPERVCWGCQRFCPADDLGCSNGTIRTPHPCELFGEDWLAWSLDGAPTAAAATEGTPVHAEGRRRK